MKRPRAAALLHDLTQACQLLESFLAGRTLAEYKRDAMLRSAVERQGEILGEAMAQLFRADAATAERITGGRRLVAFRNRLIHGYATISDEIVWGLLETHLPTLRSEAEALLAERSAPPDSRNQTS